VCVCVCVFLLSLSHTLSLSLSLSLALSLSLSLSQDTHTPSTACLAPPVPFAFEWSVKAYVSRVKWGGRERGGRERVYEHLIIIIIRSKARRFRFGI
jgi:hypothetical protein